jgi:hypothetical protein
MLNAFMVNVVAPLKDINLDQMKNPVCLIHGLCYKHLFYVISLSVCNLLIFLLKARDL